MKIYINALSARLGGGQTYLINLLKYLPKRDDCEYVVYCPSSLELPNEKNVVKISLGVVGDNFIMRSLWELFVLPFVLGRENADLLFCPGGLLISKVPKNCKTVTMFRNMIPFDNHVKNNIRSAFQKFRNLLLYHAMLYSMKNADLTIFISIYARNIIERIIGVKKAVTIPHGINDSFRSPKKPSSDIANLKKYLLYVSRFDVYKHHYEVIKGYSLLPENLRKKHKLVIIGETGSDEYQRCKELIENQNIQDDVLILGAIPYDDLPAYYQNAHINLFASSCENCPNILLEALAAGRPVLSSNVQPMPEFAESSVVYFSPYDPASINESLLSILEDDELISRLGVKAMKQSQKYSWETCAERTWNELFRLIEQT